MHIIGISEEKERIKRRGNILKSSKTNERLYPTDSRISTSHKQDICTETYTNSRHSTIAKNQRWKILKAF